MRAGDMTSSVIYPRIAAADGVLRRFSAGQPWLTGVSLAARVSRAAVSDPENI
jgi:hypothetical protein